ncbi:restriction endonuclease subunit S [Helicobacter pylori]|uniref:restriction endonuclease subunit S n=2 Tax=Helicobacter pylori TaxID=210 RepID=UPI000D3338DE|nr:restriction endonuclease subunit S [Helicobacter pylori]PUD88053.1 restriction endonuclease subunit S [Helicobacter pylori]
MDALTTPSNWQRVRLGDIAEIKRGASPRPIENPKWFCANSNVGWVRISDISKNSRFLYKTAQKLSKKGIEKSRLVKQNSLIMSMCATIGKPIITKIDTCIHDGFVVFENPKIDLNYLYYFLCYIEKEWLESGQQGSQVNLNVDLIKNKEVFCPKDLNEQAAIANILSDVDRYLCSLDALILKKESVKKALRIKMLNQILASNGVEFRELGDIILSLKTGLNPRSFFKLNTPNANNYYVTIRELEDYTIKFTHQTDRIDDNALSLCLKRSNLEKDDILFSGTGTIGKVSIIEKNPNNWAVKEGIYSIKPNKKIVFPRFLMFCLESSNIQNDIKNKSFGGIVKSIPMNDLQQIQIPLPPLNEQIAIANILSGLDSEIISLKNKKRQFENIKKALNHDLMSAKIRVLKKSVL